MSRLKQKDADLCVLIVQLFQKVPALKALAPTQSEPPFRGHTFVLLALFVVLAVVAENAEALRLDGPLENSWDRPNSPLW